MVMVIVDIVLLALKNYYHFLILRHSGVGVSASSCREGEGDGSRKWKIGYR
jgi:hypothetical protein